MKLHSRGDAQGNEAQVVPSFFLSLHVSTKHYGVGGVGGGIGGHSQQPPKETTTNNHCNDSFTVSVFRRVSGSCSTGDFDLQRRCLRYHVSTLLLQNPNWDTRATPRKRTARISVIQHTCGAAPRVGKKELAKGNSQETQTCRVQTNRSTLRH